MAYVEEANKEQQQIPNRRSTPIREMKPIAVALNARTEETIARLERDLADARAQLVWGWKARDTLGTSLRSLFRSPVWAFTTPMRIITRLQGKMRVGIDRLVPMTAMARQPDGSWEGVGVAQFLIPTLPVKGWVRIKAKIRSSVSSQACLYFDTGSGFHEGERFDLSPVGGQLSIDRLVPLRQTAYGVRFDALQHNGNYALQAFSFEPMSRVGANFLAMWVNARKMIRGGGAHRPSIWLGLKILLTGKWGTFHRQLLSNAGGEVATSSYELWQKLHEFSDGDREQAKNTIAAWKNPPLFSILLPVYDVDEIYLRQCIESVIRQIYPHWELCIADDASPQPHIRRVLHEYAARDSRIKVVYRPQNGNISAASNSALELATGQYVALLDHDDELVDRALYRMADVIVKDPALDMVYSDEDKISPQGAFSDPFFKPDWSPDYFLSCMYTCHLGVYRTELVKKIGGFRSEFDSAQDYDLVLRIIATNPKILHVPDVLYHWRAIASSTASERVLKPESHLRAKRAIQQYLDFVGRKATVEDGPAAGCHLVRYEVLGRPKISIIIPSACQTIETDGGPTWMALNCVQAIRRISTYENIEIIVVDRLNMPEKLETELEKQGVRRVTYDFDFNWARVNNHAAAEASGDYLLFLNDDTEPITPTWLELMLGYAQWPEFGAVGPKLVYPDGSLQHAGVCLPGGNPTHPFYRYPGNHPGHFYSNMVPRNWSAVTGACLLTPAGLFHSLGGFDTRFPLNYNDVAYGLAVLERGLRVVYIPQAELYHFESKTRSPEVRADEMAAIHEIWEKQFRWDPYYSPNLATDSNDFKIAPVPLHQLNLQARLTPIEEKTARTVNQPIDREKWAATRQSFSRKYLAGDGIEIGALHQPLWTPPSAHVRYVDRFDGAGLREHYPELKDFKLVNVDVLDDGEKLTTFTDASLDFIISNHMLEHCENPIGTIRNHLSKVRRGGILYYAVPDKRKTFDIERELTPFDHLVEDDRLGPERSRRKHFLEWSQWVNHQSGTKIEEEANRLMRQNYSIHYHVWDDAAFREFVESTREYLDDPFAIEELVENEFETIAILRKR